MRISIPKKAFDDGIKGTKYERHLDNPQKKVAPSGTTYYHFNVQSSLANRLVFHFSWMADMHPRQEPLFTNAANRIRGRILARIRQEQESSGKKPS